MRLVSLLALALFWSLPAAAQTESAAAETAPLFAEFLSARDTLLRDPNATLQSYQELVTRYAARVDPGSLSLDELSQAAFEGLLDLPPTRALAAERTRAFAAAEPPRAARAAAIRLRLLGKETPSVAPDAGLQETLVRDLMTHPQFPVLAASPAAREVIDALVAVGREEILRRYTAEIVSMVAHLDPRVSPDVAANLSQAALLLALAIPDKPTLLTELDKLLTFGRAALKHDLPEPQRRPAAREVARLEVILHGSGGGVVLSRRAEREARESGGLGATSRGHISTLEDFGNYLLDAFETSARLNGRAVVRFDTELPRGHTLFRGPDSWYREPGKTTVRAGDPTVAADGSRLRTFGGVRASDPAMRVRASDFALDRERRFGFMEEVSVRTPLLRLDADRVAVDGEAMELEKARIHMRLFGLSLVGVDAGRLSVDQQERLRLERARVRLFGIRVYGVDSLTGSVGSRSKAAADPEAKKEAARGRSPTYKWLKLPSLSVFEGGLSLSYNNALKFADRWTGITSFRLGTSVDPSLTLAANYNLLKITNEVDQLVSAPFLQNKFLGSYYYTIRNQDPFQENDRLFRTTLIAGASTAWNQSYEDEVGDRNEADIPFAVGVSGSTPIAGLVGFRGQLTYEHVEDEGNGEDTRLALTGIVGPRPFRIARGVHTFLRAEGTSRFNGDDTYTWYRGNAGLTLLPVPWVRLSGGYYRSWEEGTARFPYDRVSADHGYTARIDLLLGLTRLGYMNEYSDRQNRWVRNQFYISRSIGIAEPFISYDQQFDTVSFGLNLNVSAPFERLRRRRVTGIEPLPR